MGYFSAVALALILRYYGANIFREPQDVGSGPLISCYIFMTALFFLFYDLTLYPKSLRPLGNVWQLFLEFVIADFLMENLVMDFWFPLEIIIMTGLDKLSGYIEELMDQAGGWTCGKLCAFLKKESTKITSSYLTSSFFLLAVLHAVRAIDLRALRDGPSTFFGDIIFRMKKFLRRKLRFLGFGKNRRVKLKITPQIRSTSCSNKQRHCCPNKRPSKDDSLSDFEFTDDEICK